MTKQRHLLINLTILALVAAALAVLPGEQSSSLQIVSAKNTHNFTVEIADSEHEWEEGLMNRLSMPHDHGMLFIFPKPQDVTMWMKDTKIPLDMIFVDKGGKITNIKRNATPESLEYISSHKPSRAVLELNGGVTKELDIKPGDKLLYPGLFE